MLTKQAIRSNIKILANGESVSKDEIISMSEKWSEREENLFRKMIKQGGAFKIKGVKFVTVVPEILRDSKGDISLPLTHDDEE